MATDRLRFGVWQHDDLALAATLWGDAEVTKLIGGPFSAEIIAGRLASEIKHWQQYRFQYWPIFQFNNSAFVGCCGLRPRDIEARVAELGFQLCRRSWGRGYALEAAKAVIGWARAHHISALIAGHHPSNQASKRVLIRLGFTHTHDEFYAPTGLVEPCYSLVL